MNEFVIVGCPRSGTLYSARFLSCLGVRTSHEEYFTAYTPISALDDFTGWCSFTSSVGEASNLATPWSQALGDRGVHVFHQVRNPVHTIRSLIANKSFDPNLGFRHLPIIRYYFRHCPELDHDADPLLLAMEFWLRWNRMASGWTYRVEDIAKRGVDFMDVLSQISAPTARYDSCLAKFDTTYHRFTMPDPVINWRSFPPGSLKDAIAADAHKYGYTQRELEEA